MSQPTFDRDERLLIVAYKSGRFNRIGPWLFHLAAIALFAYGLYLHDLALRFGAFGCVIIYRIYEQSVQVRFRKALRSLIKKFENRIDELSKSTFQ